MTTTIKLSKGNSVLSDKGRTEYDRIFNTITKDSTTIDDTITIHDCVNECISIVSQLPR